MSITRNTPFRDVGPVSYEVWRDTITRAGGRAELASRAAWQAAGRLSGVLLRILIQESSCDTDYRANSKANNNPYNIRVKDRSNEGNPRGYIAYDNLVEATDAARRRLEGESGFFDGANPYADAVTISELLYTYAPPGPPEKPWNDTEGLITKMVNQLNAWFPNWTPPVTTPSTPAEPVEQEPPVAEYNYGNGVLPDIEKITVAENKKYAGYIDPANHIIRAFVIHSAYGSLAGTTGWFQGGNALTDYMVGNSSDGASLDGRLRQFNDPNGARYSWASGPVSNPIEDAAKFLEIYGPNKEVINMYTTALERSGDSRNAVTEKEHAKRVALIAYWANRYGKYLKDKTGKDLFTCDTFPLIPSENNRSFLIYHGEINADKRDSCPDSQVRATLDRIIADAKTTLAAWQKGGAVPSDPPVDQPGQYAQPIVIEALQAYKDKDTAPSFVKVGNDTFVFVNDRVRAIRNTPRYQSANKDGKRIGADINKGEEFAVLWLFFNEKGEAWFVTPYWTRILAADTERIKDAA